MNKATLGAVTVAMLAWDAFLLYIVCVHSCSRDYFHVLGVRRTVQASQVKSAYRTRSLAVHPDKNGGKTTAQFLELNAALEVLQDQDKRALYERYGHSMKPPAALPEGWGEAVDPQTGGVFYYHPSTGTSQWERPTAFDWASLLEEAWLKPPGFTHPLCVLPRDFYAVLGPIVVVLSLVVAWRQHSAARRRKAAAASDAERKAARAAFEERERKWMQEELANRAAQNDKKRAEPRAAAGLQARKSWVQRDDGDREGGSCAGGA